MKKRKLITLGLSMVSCFALAIGLSACEPEEPSEPIHTHSYTKEIIAPTCTEKGYTKHTCACGDEKKDTYVDELGHSYDVGESNGDGTHTKTCVNDSTHIVTEDCEGGNATCIDKPICSSCGEEYGVALGHSFTNYISNGDGTEMATCDNGCMATNTRGIVLTLNATSDAYTVTGYIGKLTEAVIPTNYKNLPVTAIGDDAFYCCASLTEIILPDSVTTIGDRAFASCENLTYIGFSENSQLTLIKNKAFFNCKKLTEISIPDNVTEIEWYAFDRCDNLKSVYITDINSWCNITFGNEYANPLYFSASLYLDNEIVTEVEIPNTMTAIKEYTFYNYSKLAKVIIPSSVTTIGNGAFNYCDSLIIYCEVESKPSHWGYGWNYSDRPVVWNCNNNDVAEDGYIYALVDGILYGIRDGVATVVQQSKSLTIANIVSTVTYKGESFSVTSVGESAFENCSKLTEVVISNGVTNIGAYAFSACSSLTKVELPDSIENIGYRVFAFSDSLTEIIIPNGLTSISDSAFESCGSLTKIILPNSLTNIGDSAFSACENLTDVTIPNGVTNIGAMVFYNCWNLENLVIPNSVKSIGYSAFSGCKKLKDVVISDNITIISSAMFSGCTSLTEIVIGGNVTCINEYAFNGCTSLTEIIIGVNVTRIDEHAFNGCKGLRKVVIPCGVTSIAKKAFNNCDNLTIYCEVESKPSGWDSYWNYSNCPVIWEYRDE